MTIKTNGYTLEGLKEFNQSYDREHRVIESDVNKVNDWIEVIEKTRSNNSPQIGDIVEYTDKHGSYYKNAHVERIDGDTNKELNICEQPYIPFVNTINGKFYTNTSGGAWSNISNELKLIGKRSKVFKGWGHCGGCTNGAIEFIAEVNVWEYIDNKQLYNGFSTKTHDRHYIFINTKEKSLWNSRYKYKGEGIAWETDKDYQDWIRLSNGVEFAGHYENQRVVWTHKQISKGLPLKEYEKIQDAIIGEVLNNGKMIECKRIYKDTTITTYTSYVPYTGR